MKTLAYPSFSAQQLKPTKQAQHRGTVLTQSPKLLKPSTKVQFGSTLYLGAVTVLALVAYGFSIKKEGDFSGVLKEAETSLMLAYNFKEGIEDKSDFLSTVLTRDAKSKKELAYKLVALNLIPSLQDEKSEGKKQHQVKIDLLLKAFDTKGPVKWNDKSAQHIVRMAMVESTIKDSLLKSLEGEEQLQKIVYAFLGQLELTLDNDAYAAELETAKNRLENYMN